MVRQISVFLENKTGRMAEATRVIGNSGVSIRALTMADTSDFGVMRFIVDDIDKAVSSLKAAGFTVKATEVIAVEVSDNPGGLASLLELLGNKGINVEYLYSLSHADSVIIFKVEDKELTVGILNSNNFKTLTSEEIKAL